MEDGFSLDDIETIDSKPIQICFQEIIDQSTLNIDNSKINKEKLFKLLMNFSQLVDSKKSTKRSSLNNLDLLGYIEENTFESEEIAKEKVFKIEKIGKISSLDDKLKGINEQNSPNKTCSTNYLSESNTSPLISGNSFDFINTKGILPNTIYSNTLNNVDPLKKNVINIYNINICGNEETLKNPINGNEQANQFLQVLGVNNNKNSTNINKIIPSQPMNTVNNNININHNNKSNLNINQNNIIQSLMYLYNQRLINTNNTNPNLNLNNLINNNNINQSNCIKNNNMNNNNPNTNSITNCNMDVDELFNINNNTNNYRTTAEATFKDDRIDDYTSFFNDNPFNQIDDFDYINNKINDA